MRIDSNLKRLTFQWSDPPRKPVPQSSSFKEKSFLGCSSFLRLEERGNVDDSTR